MPFVALSNEEQRWLGEEVFLQERNSVVAAPAADDELVFVVIMYGGCIKEGEVGVRSCVYVRWISAREEKDMRNKTNNVQKFLLPLDNLMGRRGHLSASC